MSETEQAREPELPVESEPLAAPDKSCLNCGEPLQGRFCYQCGQQDRTLVRFFPALAMEALEGLFALDSRTFRTIWALFTRPAYLSREYLRGRRAHYLPPTRLFIVFLLAAVFTISMELFLDSIGISLDQENPSQDVDVDFAGSDDGNGSGLNAEFELDGDIAELQSGVRELIGRLHFPFLSEENNRQVISLLQERTVTNIAAIQQDPREFVNQSLEYLPLLLLVMMPILALIQKLFYITSGKYYIEHLILTIHNHSFLFFCFILMFLLDVIVWTETILLALLAGILGQLLNLWMLIYLFLSLRRFFQQGYGFTALKFFLITLTYGAIFINGGLLLVLISALMY